MQLKQLIQDIAEYTVKNEIVECAMGGLSLYEINFKENNNYPLLFISPSTNHTISNNTITYQIVIYYIDRLLRDNDNNIDIVNASVSKLQQIINIIRNFDNVLKLNSDYQITNFADTQRLTDCVAGGSVTLSITVQNTQGICAVDAVLPTIKVVLQNKNVEITENGEYNITFDNGYTGLKEVKVDVNIDTESFYQEGYEEGFSKGETEGYNEGYTEGDANGRAEQKSLLESIKITENGIYDNENGYDVVDVEVDTSGAYNEGFDKGKAEGVEQGKAEQKSLIQPITITENGTFANENGYSPINVNLDLESIYNNGYNEGYTEGEVNGVEQGKAEQKALLESITITENGVFTNENGYDEVIVDVPTGGGGEGDYEEGYEEGYNQSKQDIIDNAQTLYVTKNGTYGIERAVTGYYDDGTPFYDYAILNNVVFATGIEVSPETEVEVWFKTTQYINNEGIVASQNMENTNAIFKLVEGEGYFTGEIGGTQPNIFDMEGAKLELNKWYHLKMSYINGLWVNGKQVGDYQESSNVVAPYFELFINGYSNQDWYGYAGLNNYFGMVKINGQTFIPKEDSFWNITEDYGLNLSVMGDNAYYEFKKDTGEYPLENLIKEVIVDVPTGGGEGDYEEGYNKGYEEGIANAEEEIAETAQVLRITENGRYTTKYTDTSDSDAVVTGYFDDGTPFYNYGFCNKIAYDTGIKVTPTTTLEVWYKTDNWEEIDTAIVATQSSANYDAIFKIVKDRGKAKAEISRQNITTPNPMVNGEWYHLKLSYEEGFWVNDEFMGYITNNVTGTPYNLAINSFLWFAIENSSSNAYYGMIKIDNQTIIPTEQGFYNVTTDSYLDIINPYGGEYLYTEVKPNFTGNLIKEVIVEVPTSGGDSSVLKIPNGMKLGYSSVIPSNIDTSEVVDMSYFFYQCEYLTSISLIDTSKVTNMRRMFAGCSYLKSIPLIDTSKVTDMSYIVASCYSLTSLPQLDTSNVTNMEYAFNGCDNLTSLPQLDTLNVTNMKDMFNGCRNLTSIPLINTSNVTDMKNMFYQCTSLTSLPQLDTSKVTDMSYMLHSCNSLTSLPSLYCGNITSKNYYPVYNYSSYEHLTDVGGFIDMKYSWDNNYGLVKCPNLTYQSCINILNGLYDFTGNGETPNSSQGRLKVHQNFLDLVGDEISIGTNKGWNIFA